MRSILMVTAEFSPLAKTGGLGEVCGTLPLQLKKEGVDVRVIMPRYASIPIEYTANMRFVKEIYVYLGWRKQYCGIFELNWQGVQIYLVDNLYYFGGDSIYSDENFDIERFAFFGMAVLSALPHVDFSPEVIHCHDWHTSFVPILHQAHFKRIQFYSKMKMIMTIHNLKYQGFCEKERLHDLLGINDEYSVAGAVQVNGNMTNCLKGALSLVDKITTVSETYAREIQNSYFGEGLDWLLRWRVNDLVGILNGIDYDLYNPEADPMIPLTYSTNNFAAHKKKNKMKIQEVLKLDVNSGVPVIALVSRFVGQKGIELIMHVLDDMLSNIDMQFIVLGTGEGRYEQYFRDMAARYPDKMSANIFYEDVLAHRIYAGADFILMPSLFEPCGISQLIALRYGTLPIVRETGGLNDTVISFNEETGEGNGYTFTHFNAHDMMYTVQRALAIYQNREMHNSIVRSAMCCDFSWEASAKQYIQLYENL